MRSYPALSFTKKAMLKQANELAGATSQRRPVLILGLGNLLLGDDGLGLRLLEELASAKAATWEHAVDFLDGGTQGLALAGEISGRRAVVILDAISDAICVGSKPGTVHVLQSPRTASGALVVESPDGDVRPFSSGDSKVGPATAHGCNAQELIATVALLGESPEELFVVGIEPERVSTGIGLSASVERAVGPALSRATEVVEQILCKSSPELQGV